MGGEEMLARRAYINQCVARAVMHESVGLSSRSGLSCFGLDLMGM